MLRLIFTVLLLAFIFSVIGLRVTTPPDTDSDSGIVITDTADPAAAEMLPTPAASQQPMNNAGRETEQPVQHHEATLVVPEKMHTQMMQDLDDAKRDIRALKDEVRKIESGDPEVTKQLQDNLDTLRQQNGQSQAPPQMILVPMQSEEFTRLQQRTAELEEKARVAEEAAATAQREKEQKEREAVEYAKKYDELYQRQVALKKELATPTERPVEPPKRIRAKTLEFVTYSQLEEAVRASEETGKPILLMFTGDRCRLCRIIENSILTRSDVQAYIKEHYVFALVNGDVYGKTADMFHVTRYPTAFIYSPDQSSMPPPGFIMPATLPEFMTAIKS
jgi:hypothetical protein